MSDCQTYRYVLERRWDHRPLVLALMFNPSAADAEIDDPTISLLSHIASHNGYGAVTVVNLIPYRSPEPAGAVEMVRQTGGLPVDKAHALQVNLSHIKQQASKASAMLFAWGNLAPNDVAEYVWQISNAAAASLPKHANVYCLGVTQRGNPIHPMATGRFKVAKNTPFKPWEIKE